MSDSGNTAPNPGILPPPTPLTPYPLPLTEPLIIKSMRSSLDLNCIFALPPLSAGPNPPDPIFFVYATPAE